ncbi:MAG: uracil-DNA glycosylase [Gammaproteobacteria bacterium]|nr:uracil-DNA glycosylase [Gammaproteobacteria bacterium]
MGQESRFSRAQRDLLELMDVSVWTGRAGSQPPGDSAQSAEPAAGATAPATRDALVPGADAPAPGPATSGPPELEALRSKVAACKACGLHAGRRQTVFGVGNPRADWMFVGEGPGEEEDRRGEPFVGRAGKLLDAMLQAMKLDRTIVYIANIVKCRPPGNRNPSLEEAAACIPYLTRQVELIAPRLIVALGAVAAQRLLETDRPVGALRGKLHYAAHLEPPVLVTYHPAYLLRSPGQKRKAWEDLQLAMREMAALPGEQNAV